jgi:hypothetical protein
MGKAFLHPFHTFSRIGGKHLQVYDVHKCDM